MSASIIIIECIVIFRIQRLLLFLGCVRVQSHCFHLCWLNWRLADLNWAQLLGFIIARCLLIDFAMEMLLRNRLCLFGLLEAVDCHVFVHHGINWTGFLRSRWVLLWCLSLMARFGWNGRIVGFLVVEVDDHRRKLVSYQRRRTKLIIRHLSHGLSIFLRIIEKISTSAAYLIDLPHLDFII